MFWTGHLQSPISRCHTHNHHYIFLVETLARAKKTEFTKYAESAISAIKTAKVCHWSLNSASNIFWGDDTFFSLFSLRTTYSCVVLLE